MLGLHHRADDQADARSGEAGQHAAVRAGDRAGDRPEPVGQLLVLHGPALVADGAQLVAQLGEGDLRVGPGVGRERAVGDARGQVGRVEVGEEQLADGGVHGGQRGAHLDVRGHQIGIAQPDEVQDAVGAEHGQVHRLPGALAELGQLGRGDGDQVQAAQRGRAEGQRAHARPSPLGRWSR